MSDLWQRKGWTPYPFLATEQDYSPRVHWVMTALPSIHLGYAAVAIGLFLPMTAFFLRAMRYEENLSAHGIGSRQRWLGSDSAPAGGDD